MGEIKRKVYEDFRGDRSLDGFVEVLEWRCSEHGGPWLAGTYYCSNGDGRVFELETTGSNNTGKELMEAILEARSHAHFDDGSELTDSDLINLYHTYNVWYKEDGYEEFDYGELSDYGTEYVVYKNPPKYYLVSQLNGPNDSEPYGEPIVEKDFKSFLIDHDKDRRLMHETTRSGLTEM